MICPFCSQSVADGMKFCTGCGKRIPVCPSCGNPVTRATKYCISCGNVLPDSVAAALAGASSAAGKGNTSGPDSVSSIAEQIQKSLAEENQDIPSPSPARKHFCTSCGSPCPPEQKLCDACRAKQAQPDRPKSFCVSCGAPVAAGETLCSRCRSKSNPRKTPLVPILIGIVAALLLTIGGIAFWAVSHSGDSAQTSDSDTSAEASAEEETVEPEPDVVIEQTVPEDSDASAEETVEENEPDEEEPPEEEPDEEPVEETPDESAEEDPDSVEAMGKVDYFIQHCNDQYFTADYFAGFTKEEARIARNGVYARCGRDFEDQELVNYYTEHFDWYSPQIDPDSWNDNRFNSYEKANLQVVVDYEISKGYRKG